MSEFLQESRGTQLHLFGDPHRTADTPRTETPRVLDLFAGLGGLSLGFSRAGFEVTGADLLEESARVFEFNRIGSTITVDLAKACVLSDAPVVVGGPPCRPWSALNQAKDARARAHRHREWWRLLSFFRDVGRIRPALFLMENVPPVRGDPAYAHLLGELGRAGYDISARRVSYAAFGAATTRTRLITVGVLGVQGGSDDFFRRLARRTRPATTVGDAIGWLRGRAQDPSIDHVWPSLTTIGKYAERYLTRRYGWYRLVEEHPAPSFSNVMKTYILPPESIAHGVERVLSVREVLSIMGFDREFRFPPDVPLGRRYQMVADAVSPLLSTACAEVVREMLWGAA